MCTPWRTKEDSAPDCSITIWWGSQERGGKSSTAGELHQLSMGFSSMLGRTSWGGEKRGFHSCERAVECMCSTWETWGWTICQLGAYELASDGRATWEMCVSITDNMINKNQMRAFFRWGKKPCIHRPCFTWGTSTTQYLKGQHRKTQEVLEVLRKALTKVLNTVEGGFNDGKAVCLTSNLQIKNQSRI